MSKPINSTAITGSLLLVVFLWGGNNAGTKWLVMTSWPPIWTGGTRFLFAGLILLALLRFTRWLGEFHPLTRGQQHQLWLRGGLSLAAYVVVFCWALKLTAASHVALYIGASPIWALLIEERPRWDWSSVRRYGAALLAMSGVLTLFWPALHLSSFNLAGEVCGLLSSLLWANYNHQGRFLAKEMSGLEVAANSMWMSGAMLIPLGLLELYFATQSLVLDQWHLGVQVFNILLGGVVPYALWNSALRHWQTSRVMLFNNFIPISTTTWAYFTLHEPITPTFCTAMILIVAGVLLGQMDWAKVFKQPESFLTPSRFTFAAAPRKLSGAVWHWLFRRLVYFVGIVMDVKNLSEVPPFTTKDGSEIRELLAHRNSAIRNQSLAEARLPAGGSTQEHFHPRTEEIYYITHGTGKIRIEGETRLVGPGDAIAILPGQKHKLWNTGSEALRLLCCCAPAYEHSDTVITES